MNKLCLFLLAAALAGCQRELDEPVELPPPVMHYINLHDAEVTPGGNARIDINGDGVPDFTFSTLLVGDPVLQRDRLQYYANSSISASLLNDASDESPMLSAGDWIRPVHSGYQWFTISAIVMTEQITPLQREPFWQGLWKDARHHFLPVQVTRNGGNYHGWIEISFDREKRRMFLHGTGICTEAGRSVKAGA